LNKLKRFLATGGIWSMSDQAIVSLGNFLLAITLARSLNKVEYGTYIVIFGALLVANALHAALIVYPLSVLGAHRSASDLKRLAANSILITLCMGVPVSGVLIATAWLFTKRTDLFVVVVAAMFAWQIQETLRRSLMSHLRHRRAIFGDFITYIGQFLFVYVMVRRNVPMSARAGFEAIIAGSVAGTIVHAFAIGIRLPRLSDSWRLAREYFHLGRYPLFSILGYSGTALLFPWVLAFRSLAEVANFQATMNLVQVVNPIMFSVGNLVVPAVAHAMKDTDGEPRALRATNRYLLEGLAVLMPLFTMLLIAPRWVMQIVYGRVSGYTEHDAIVRILVVGALATYVGHVLNSYYMGTRQVSIVGKGQIISSAAAVLCAFAFIPLWGVPGAALSYVAMGMGRAWPLLLNLRQTTPLPELVETAAVINQGEKY
jgi:O-antigen/teichoic acid export membrane protein